jgi:hypothetical protein
MPNPLVSDWYGQDGRFSTPRRWQVFGATAHRSVGGGIHQRGLERELAVMSSLNDAREWIVNLHHNNFANPVLLRSEARFEPVNRKEVVSYE